MHKLLAILIIVIGLNQLSCNLIASFKIRDAMLEESINQNKFYTKIPFKQVGGLIMIELEINQHKRNFIFDSGALTSISTKIAHELKYNIIGKQKHVDSNGENKYLKTIKIKEFSIDTIDFSAIVASLHDFDHLSKALCIDISGIVGANIMNKAVWQIDYTQQTIILTDAKKNLNIPDDSSILNFNAYGKGTPIFNIELNNIDLGEILLDTGSNGNISLPYQEQEKRLNQSSSYIERSSKRISVFLEQTTTTKTFNSLNITLDKHFVPQHPLVSFGTGLSRSLIGNKFLNNYLVTIDWPYQQLILSNYSQDSSHSHETFGISLTYESGKGLLVGAVIKNASAYQQGIRINDKVVTINQTDFTNSTRDDYCNVLTHGISNENELNIILEREGRQRTYRLTKSNFMDFLKD